MNEKVEQAEVILSNLLALQHPTDSAFIVGHDDVVVTLRTAVELLVEEQERRMFSVKSLSGR